MNLRIAIVDDMEDDRSRLSEDVCTLLAQKGRPCDILTFESAEEFLTNKSSGAVDIAFLDVRMGGMNGIELAKRMRRVDSTLIVVFVTSSREYALDAFPVHPFDYLVKPYTTTRLSAVIDDILVALRLRSEQKTIRINVPYGGVDVPVDRVAIIEARSHSSVLTLENGQEIRSTMSFAEVHALVSTDERFLLVNRGIVINMDRVVSVEGATVVMDGGARLPLRKRDRSELARSITQHLISRTGRRYRG